MVHYVVNYEQEEERLQSQYASTKQKGILPQSNYQDKYKHLIGETSAKEAAQSTQTNRSYGFGMYSKPVTNGPQQEKTCLLRFRKSETQTTENSLLSYRG